MLYLKKMSITNCTPIQQHIHLTGRVISIPLIILKYQNRQKNSHIMQKRHILEIISRVDERFPPKRCRAGVTEPIVELPVEQFQNLLFYLSASLEYHELILDVCL